MRMMIIGDMEFNTESEILVHSVDTIVFHDDNNVDLMEIGEEYLDNGHDSYSIPSYSGRPYKSECNWYMLDRVGNPVLFDTKLRLVSGFNDIRELLEAYPNSRPIKLIDDRFNWSQYNSSIE